MASDTPPKPRTYGAVPKGSGTAYGRVSQGQATSERRLRNISAVLTLPAVGVSAATLVGIGHAGAAGPLLTMNPVVAGMAGAPILTAGLAISSHQKAKHLSAHGHAVDGLISRSRGGSSSLGMRGVVPLSKNDAWNRKYGKPSKLGGPAISIAPQKPLSKTSAVGTGIVAGGVAAGGTLAVGYGAHSIASLLTRAAPKFAPALGPVGVAFAAGYAGYSAYQGYKQHGVAGAILGPFGGADLLSMSQNAKANSPAASSHAGGAFLNHGAARSDRSAPAAILAMRTGTAAQQPAYKDNWTDSRGRNYTRKSLDVRKAN